jgi:hypothetical protein
MVRQKTGGRYMQGITRRRINDMANSIVDGMELTIRRIETIRPIRAVQTALGEGARQIIAFYQVVYRKESGWP